MNTAKFPRISILRWSLLLAAFLLCACGSAVTQPSGLPKDEARSEQTPPAASPTPSAEPVAPLDAHKFSGALRETWRRFTAGGRYRLAQTSDMRFPERAREEILRSLPTDPVPFVYIWGGLNYKKRVADDHLAAIVVDTIRQDDNRFGLVIFSPPAGEKEVFETHWLYRHRDLSKTTVGRASGELYVTEYFGDGTRKSCSVRWNPKRNQFECKS